MRRGGEKTNAKGAEPAWLQYCRMPTEQTARRLLGMHLVRKTPEGVITGKIVEVEAYGGTEDAGSHISRAVTERTKIMAEAPGLAYVYIIYGMHHCLNVVAHVDGAAGAVLIRAVEPLSGVELMQRRRGAVRERELCNGPGKLCQAFGITKELNGHCLTEPPLYLTGGDTIAEDAIEVTKRINIDYAGEAKEWPWRFYIKANRYVSRK